MHIHCAPFLVRAGGVHPLPLQLCKHQLRSRSQLCLGCIVGQHADAVVHAVYTAVLRAHGGDLEQGLAGGAEQQVLLAHPALGCTLVLVPAPPDHVPAVLPVHHRHGGAGGDPHHHRAFRAGFFVNGYMIPCVFWAEDGIAHVGQLPLLQPVRLLVGDGRVHLVIIPLGAGGQLGRVGKHEFLRLPWLAAVAVVFCQQGGVAGHLHPVRYGQLPKADAIGKGVGLYLPKGQGQGHGLQLHAFAECAPLQRGNAHGQGNAAQLLALAEGVGGNAGHPGRHVVVLARLGGGIAQKGAAVGGKEYAVHRLQGRVARFHRKGFNALAAGKAVLVPFGDPCMQVHLRRIQVGKAVVADGGNAPGQAQTFGAHTVKRPLAQMHQRFRQHHLIQHRDALCGHSPVLLGIPVQPGAVYHVLGLGKHVVGQVAQHLYALVNVEDVVLHPVPGLRCLPGSGCAGQQAAQRQQPSQQPSAPTPSVLRFPHRHLSLLLRPVPWNPYHHRCTASVSIPIQRCIVPEPCTQS